jgi:hypothetical protein
MRSVRGSNPSATRPGVVPSLTGARLAARPVVDFASVTAVSLTVEGSVRILVIALLHI